MQICVLIEPHLGASYADQLAVTRLAERLGFHGLFRSDHYLSVTDGRPGPTDTWITLAGLARETRRIVLGSLVSSATFRLPGPTAIGVAQVDAMSGGRIEFGLGAGWWAAEHQSAGITFPPTAERLDRLEEQLAIITGLWATASGSRFTHDGPHYRLRDAPGMAPFRRRGPPVIVGGSGAPRTPAIAARFAQEFNSGWETPDETARQFARVLAACAAVGRDRTTMRLSTVQPIDAGPREIADRISHYAASGAQRVYLELLDLRDHGLLSAVALAVLPDPRPR